MFVEWIGNVQCNFNLVAKIIFYYLELTPAFLTGTSFSSVDSLFKTDTSDL